MKPVSSPKSISTALKEKLQCYCAAVNARRGVNHIRILKNLKDFLEILKSIFCFSQIKREKKTKNKNKKKKKKTKHTNKQNTSMILQHFT
jgi:tRNA C32,U32 (ribose-2'-O)-methylase TrmJ